MSGPFLDQLLVITAVEREADAIRAAAAEVGLGDDVVVVSAGVGRVNAAVAVARMLVGAPLPRAILSAGVAGVLPSPDPPVIGDTVVGSASTYHEEGIVHEHGFSDVASMGFPLLPGTTADGNRLPADPMLASAVIGALPYATLGPIATVATCSGTDAHAAAVRERTHAVVEAMEGAAVLHTAAIFGVPAIEIRTISNTTGDREHQQWNLDLALDRLRAAAASSLRPLLAARREPPR